MHLPFMVCPYIKVADSPGYLMRKQSCSTGSWTCRIQAFITEFRFASVTSSVMASTMVHPESKFKPFSITRGTLTDIAHTLTKSENTPLFCPLMAGIQGGSCTVNYCDFDSKHAASLASVALGIPFVAFNRPSYKDSATFLSPHKGTTCL